MGQANKTYVDQQAEIATVKGQMLEAMQAAGKRDVAIWIAVFTELLKWCSDLNLKAERGADDV